MWAEVKMRNGFLRSLKPFRHGTAELTSIEYQERQLARDPFSIIVRQAVFSDAIFLSESGLISGQIDAIPDYATLARQA